MHADKISFMFFLSKRLPLGLLFANLLSLHRQVDTGCLKFQAEIIPAEPGPGNAG